MLANIRYPRTIRADDCSLERVPTEHGSFIQEDHQEIHHDEFPPPSNKTNDPPFPLDKERRLSFSPGKQDGVALDRINTMCQEGDAYGAETRFPSFPKSRG